MVKKYWTEFLRTKYDSLDGQTTIAYTENSGSTNPFTVKVTRSGMDFSGTMDKRIVTTKDLTALAELIGNAWEEHLRIAPKITKDFKEF